MVYVLGVDGGWLGNRSVISGSRVDDYVEAV